MKEEFLINDWFSGKMVSYIEIINFGSLNTSDGPDILDAEISIDGMTYCGSIEFDVKKSNWLHHGHFQNRFFQNTMLHLFHLDDMENYQGYFPKFSLCTENKKFEKYEQKKENFLEKRIGIYKRLSLYFEWEESVSILFARTLGLYKNREVMTYAAIANYLKIPLNRLELHSFNKAVRPENRFDIRIKQYLDLEVNYKFTKELIYMMYHRRKLEDIYFRFRKYPITVNRINLFIFNYLIPLFIIKAGKDNIGFLMYLEDIFYKLHRAPQIKRLHPVIPKVF